MCGIFEKINKSQVSVLKNGDWCDDPSNVRADVIRDWTIEKETCGDDLVTKSFKVKLVQ